MSDYPYTIRPIDHWPGERTKYRRASPFHAGIMQTTKLLRRELHMIGATDVILQIDVRERDLRIDGSLRADARPESPALILSFASKYGPLSYAVDRFDDWRDNLRAIALGLEALRAVDRYGVTKRGEQYSGWLALSAPADDLTVDQARDLIARHGGWVMATKAAHPDLGGDAILFRRLTAAKRILAAAGAVVP